MDYEKSKTMNDAPEWWLRAKELERQDRFEEAEAIIQQALSSQGYPWQSQIAQMYKDRMDRLLDSAQKTEATDAARKAAQWMRAYASEATSGSEGAMLSYERDQFLSELKAALAQHG